MWYVRSCRRRFVPVGTKENGGSYPQKGARRVAIYHCSIKVISRGKGKSAVAAAAYQAGEKIILYGASIVGRDMAAALQCEKVEFYGFCDREYARFPDGLMGKPVISPDELLNHPNQYYVVIATGIFYYAGNIVLNL